MEIADRLSYPNVLVVTSAVTGARRPPARLDPCAGLTVLAVLEARRRVLWRRRRAGGGPAPGARAAADESVKGGEMSVAFAGWDVLGMSWGRCVTRSQSSTTTCRSSI
jgi:predicted signal transduction protein with EAL and GGDEF domain